MSKSGPENTMRVKAVKEIEKRYGSMVVVVKYHGSQFSQAGVSDLLCCVAGVFVAIELKAPGSGHQPTIKQQAFLDRVDLAGGYSACLDSVESVINFIESVINPAIL